MQLLPWEQQFNTGLAKPATNVLDPINVSATRAAGITAAAGTGLAQPLFVFLFTEDKSVLEKRTHSNSLCHPCGHCKSFAPAAPRRARTSVSESFWGLRLSAPLPVIGLLSRYLNNYLIGRSPILNRLRFQRCLIPESIAYPVLSSVSRGYPGVEGRLATCYSAVRPALVRRQGCNLHGLVRVR